MAFNKKTSFLTIFALLACLVSIANAKGDSCGCGKGGCQDGCRRTLAEIVEEQDHQDAWNQHKEQCESVSYTLAVNAEHHISLLAKPIPHQSTKDCHPLVFHDSSNSIRQNGKHVAVVEPNLSFTGEHDEFGMHWDNSFRLGIYTLAELAEAFDMAGSSLGREYNIVHNNCATFALSMAKGLKLEVTPEVTDYVTGKLSQSRIPYYVRKSASLGDLVSGGQEMSSKIDTDDSVGLMKLLVDRYLRDNGF